MKKDVMVLFLLGVLLVSPLILAQEQIQTQEQTETYSGFNRFTDNVKMFFSGRDNKVMLALEIREKEVNSAMVNVQNGDDEAMSDNLKNAWKKLQVVQKKVSVNTAEEVKENSNEVRENIMNQEDLPNDFEVYVLEEEKTGLTAEWVVETSVGEDGKEGQTLGREVVYEIDGEIIVKIENRIDEIDNEIAEWVIENSVGKDVDNGLTWEVKTEVTKGDNGLKPEVKNYVAGDGTLKNDPLPEPDLNKVNPDLYDPDARAPGDTWEVDDGGYAEGTTADGNCGDGVDCGSGEPGTEGTNDVGPAVDSNEGDEDSSGGEDLVITGEVIKDSNSKRMFGWLF